MKHLLPQKKKRFYQTLKGTVISLFLIIALVSYVGFEHQNAWKNSMQADIYHTLLMEKQAEIDGNQLEVVELKKQLDQLRELVGIPPEQQIALKVKQYFPDDYKTALMVFEHESGLNPKAVGYNCYYGPISTSCTPLDRFRAYSVDCGLTQENVAGKVCPPEMFNVDYNLKVARSKYVLRSWEPWVAHNSGAYLSHETQVDNILAYQDQLISLGVIQ